VFILQLRNCADEGMLWFLECSPYFVVHGVNLLFVALVELLGLRMTYFIVYEILVVCE
jgi:hypothetical protein